MYRSLEGNIPKWTPMGVAIYRAVRDTTEAMFIDVGVFSTQTKREEGTVSARSSFVEVL